MKSIDRTDEQDPFLDKEQQSLQLDLQARQLRSKREKRWRASTWVLGFLLLAQSLAVLMWRPNNKEKRSYERGFATDFDGFIPSIKTIQHTFTGALHPDQDGNVFMVREQDGSKFVGSPAEEVDKSWEELLNNRYFRFTDSELESLDKSGRLAGTQEPNNVTQRINARGVFGGVDMFHSLHCLNSLRKSAQGTMEMQYTDLPADFAQTHIDHCVEQLRQSILCHGDLTPLTLTPIWNQNSRILLKLGQTEYPHTCRDWREFVKVNRRRASASGGGDD